VDFNFTQMPTKLKKQIEDAANKYKIENNTFVADKVPDKARKVEVEIGDVKEADFLPQFKTKHWDNECNFSVRLVDDFGGNAEVLTDKEKILWRKQDVEARFYEKDGGADYEDGAFEFDVVLKKKPKNNWLDFTLQHKGLRFLFQPEITDEQAQRYADHRGVSLEEARNIIRPPHIVRSWAVYHENKRHDFSKVGGKNYGTGKAFHIPRPEITDAEGKKFWGELSIDAENNKARLTLPEGMVYPVVVDPTFGYTSIGGSTEWNYSNDVFGDIYTAPAAGNVESISWYHRQYSSGDSFKGLLGTDGGVIMGIGADTDCPSSFAWATSTIAAQPAISASTDYAICVISDGEPDFRYDTDGGIVDIYDGSNSFSSPQNFDTSDTGSFKYSMYATYSEAATDVDDARAAKIAGKAAANDARSAKIYAKGANKEYSLQNSATLPSDDALLSTIYEADDYTAVEDDDASRVEANGGDATTLHQFKDKGDNPSAEISATANLQTAVAPSTKTVYLQIFNRTSGEWETVDSDNTTGANTDFELSASITENLDDYYDANNWVSFRIYQQR